MSLEKTSDDCQAWIKPMTPTHSLIQEKDVLSVPVFIWRAKSVSQYTLQMFFCFFFKAMCCVNILSVATLSGVFASFWFKKIIN